MDLSFLHSRFCQTALHGLKECLPGPLSGYSKDRCFRSRNSLHSKRIVTVVPPSWNSLVFPCSPQSWSSWLEVTVKWSLKKNYLFIFIQLQLSAFSPHPSTPPQPVALPSPTFTLPLDFVLVSFIVAPEMVFEDAITMPASWQHFSRRLCLLWICFPYMVLFVW